MLFLLVACRGMDLGDGPAPGEDGAAAVDSGADIVSDGSLSLRFGIDPDYVVEMTEDPTGTFYGGIYLEQFVTPVGLTDDAVALETLEIALVLPLDGSLQGPVYQTGPLPFGKVYVLGYVDTDDNSPVVGPDSGDPVTRPGFDDRWAVPSGESADADVIFDLLMP